METDPETREHEHRTHIEKKGLQDRVEKRPSEKKNRGTRAQKLRETQREAETDSRTGTQRERAHRDTVRGRAGQRCGVGPARWSGLGRSRLTSSLILKWKLEEIGLWLK